MRRVLIISAATVLAASAALASEQTPWIGVRAKALDTLQTRDCGAAKCEAASTAERANPPVTDDEARTIYLRGFYSGASEHCGLGWQARNYTPMMAYWQNTAHKSARQMALIGSIHDIAQSMAKTALGRIGPCSPDLKSDIDKRLDFRPPAAG